MLFVIKFLHLLFFFSFTAGTLTQNEMVFKRLHLGTVSYGTDTMDEIQSHIIQSYAQVKCFFVLLFTLRLGLGMGTQYLFGVNLNNPVSSIGVIHSGDRVVVHHKLTY